MDVLFILDASGSVQRIFEEEIRLSNTIINELTVGPNNARIAFIRFAGPNKERTVIGFEYVKHIRHVAKLLIAVITKTKLRC